MNNKKQPTMEELIALRSTLSARPLTEGLLAAFNEGATAVPK